MTESQLKKYVDENAKKIIKAINRLKQEARELERFADVTQDMYDAAAYEAKAEAYKTALELLVGVEEV